MLYILWGEDQFSIQEKLSEIKTGLGDASMLSLNTSVLEGRGLSLSELKAASEAAPFLSPQRLVIVSGLLQRFEAKEKTAKSKKGDASGADEAAAFAACINGLPPSTVLVLVEIVEARGGGFKDNPVHIVIAEKAQVVSFPILKGPRLAGWIQERVTHQGGAISQQAVNLLMELIGGDLFNMSNELSKLAAFTAGRRIEEKDIKAVVVASQETDIFALVDAVMERRAGPAAAILQKLLQEGVVPPQVLVLLARQLQVLVQVKDLKSQKKSSAEIQKTLGMFNSWVWTKMSGRAEKYTMERLKEIYRSLLAADLAIKTGKYDGDLALNILVAELCG
jgi:DNA polymerase III subunit delta